LPADIALQLRAREPCKPPGVVVQLLKFLGRQLAIVTIVTVLVIATGHLVSYLLG